MLNKAQLIGHLGKDPEFKTTKSGEKICQISVATSETRKNQHTGQNEQLTEWHTVVFFGKLAEVASSFLHKGSKVYVEGKIITQKYMDKNGVDRWTTKIIGQGLKMLDSRDPSQQNFQNHEPQRTNQQAQTNAPSHQNSQNAGDVEYWDNNLPF